MTIAFWCLLAGGLMPLLWTSAAKWGGERKLGQEENRNPRAFLATLDGIQGRAHAAQQNAFEAFPLFVAAVLVAQMAGATQTTVDGLALAWVGLRIAYGICYLKDWAEARSLVWFGSVGCCIALFVIAA